MSQARLGPGCRVAMHFTLSLADDTEVESTRDGEPMDFQVGTGDLDTGLEGLLGGLCAGDRATFHIQPGEVFADPDPTQVHPMARSEFPEDLPLRRGVVVGFDLPNGEQVAGTVMEVTGNEVLVDFNHPLAGKALRWEVEIVSITRDA